MTGVRFASVALESPLPQLDRLFDYAVPESLASMVLPGVRVLVPFGKGESLVDGFVVSTSNTTSFDGELNSIGSVISAAQVLPEPHYRLCRAVADRQAGTLAEVLKLAVPKRSVRVEKAWLAAAALDSAAEVSIALPALSFAGKPAHFEGRQTAIVEPRLVPFEVASNGETHSADSMQAWILHLIAFALEHLRNGKSAILVVPDFRDQNRLRASLELLGLGKHLVSFSTEQTSSERYAAYLSCLGTTPKVIVGSRAASWAPVTNLGGIAVFDDADQSLSEPTAPYVHIRDVVLLRQQQTGCSLYFASHSRSAEVARYLEIGFFTDVTQPFAKPQLAVTDPGLRVDATSYQLARTTLEAGGAVLIQVAATGNSTSTYCQDCGTRSRCRFCNGPVFIDAAGTQRCRWCSALNLGTPCPQCGSARTRSGLAGSARTATELGKSFPGVPIVESTHVHRIESVKPGKRLVVATPGAEPWVDGGYQAVILLDATRLLSKDTLRATEQAISLWSNAISLMAPRGRAVGVGLASNLGQKLALWQHAELASDELAARRELRFPPACRLASITGPKPLISKMVDGLVEAIETAANIEVLGPLQSDEQRPDVPNSVWRYLIRYDYAAGEPLARELKARALKVNAANRGVTSKSGRVSRAVRVRMDDSEVI